MSLTALRTREEELKRDLANVRAALDDATARALAAARAESSLAEATGTMAGAYRDAAAERVQRWRADVEAGRGAVERRDKLRLDEATLLEELEKTRLQRADAEALLGAVPGARFHPRVDGRILARDRTATQRNRVVRLGRASVAALLVASSVVTVVLFDRLGCTPARPSLDLEGARHLTIESAEARTRLHAELEAKPGGFSFDVTCGGPRAARRHGEVTRAQVQEFLTAVEARAPTTDPAAYCADADDRPTSTVVVVTPKTTVELTTRACSKQWSANGRTLAEDPHIVNSFGGNAGPHAAINASYDALLDAMGATDCQVEASSIP